MVKNDLQMSRRIRRTPFTDKVEKHGVTGFTVVNHTLLPKAFGKSVNDDYWHLRKDVQIWDVGCQRQVQICGPDAEKLIHWLTPRDLSKASVGKCFYTPLISETAGLINDPVLLKIAADKYWLSIADSDVLLWVKGLAVGANLNVQLHEPDVWPLAIQGPKAETVLTEIFGSKLKNLKFFNFEWFDFEGTKQIIARSGYSKQGGFEIYLDGSKYGSLLWEKIWNAGVKHNIRAGAPNIIERIESGLLSYGNEMTIDNNPIECCLDKYCNPNNSYNYIGKKALKEIIKVGVKKKIRGVRFSGVPMEACGIPWPVMSKKTKKMVGQITSGIFSPRLKTNIGLAMIDKESWDHGEEIYVHTSDGITKEGFVCNLPFQ